MQITANIKFNTELNTATMNLITPLDSASYSNIRLPYATKHFLPLIYDKKYEEQVYQAVSGSTLYPKCVVGKGYVNTFDKKVYSYGLDSCQHVLASDCSDQFTHAVLAKEVNGLKEVTVYSGDTKLVVKPGRRTLIPPTTTPWRRKPQRPCRVHLCSPCPMLAGAI